MEVCGNFEFAQVSLEPRMDITKLSKLNFNSFWSKDSREHGVAFEMCERLFELLAPISQFELAPRELQIEAQEEGDAHHGAVGLFRLAIACEPKLLVRTTM